MNKNRASSRLGAGFALALLILLSACASKTPAPVVERGQPTTASATAGRDTYVVKSGDTLISIAREHGMDMRELVALNNIDNPNRIAVGRVLKVRPASAQVAPAESVAVVAPVSSETVSARPIDGMPQSSSVVSAGDELKREPKVGKVVYSDQALAQAQNSGVAKATEPAGVVESTKDARPETAASDDIVWSWPAAGKVIATFSEGGSKGIDIAGKAGDPVIAAGEGKVVYSGTALRGYGELVIIKHNATYLSAYAHNQRILVEEGQTVSKGQKIAEMGSTDAERVKLHFEIRKQHGKPVDPLKYLPQR